MFSCVNKLQPFHYIYVLVCSCLATIVLIGQYLPTERVVVSGGWGNGSDRQLQTSLLHVLNRNHCIQPPTSYLMAKYHKCSKGASWYSRDDILLIHIVEWSQLVFIQFCFIH